jgi:hypothetical protein
LIGVNTPKKICATKSFSPSSCAVGMSGHIKPRRCAGRQQAQLAVAMQATTDEDIGKITWIARRAGRSSPSDAAIGTQHVEAAGLLLEQLRRCG